MPLCTPRPNDIHAFPTCTHTIYTFTLHASHTTSSHSIPAPHVLFSARHGTILTNPVRTHCPCATVAHPATHANISSCPISHLSTHSVHNVFLFGTSRYHPSRYHLTPSRHNYDIVSTTPARTKSRSRGGKVSVCWFILLCSRLFHFVSSHITIHLPFISIMPRSPFTP